MRASRLCLLPLLASCAAPQDFAPDPSPDRQAVVYGQDDRTEPYSIDDPALRALGDATAGVFDASGLVYDEPRGDWVVDRSVPLRDRYAPLCPNEPFADQPTAAMCTGFLVGERALVTAGHCITSSSCWRTRFAFGYGLDSPGAMPDRIPSRDVYRCAAVFERRMAGQADYAVVVLDRSVPDREPLAFRTEGAPTVGTPLLLVGHPVGLPLKFAPNAEVKEVTEYTLEASVDAYGGNSGSPVFNALTLEVEGILASGQQDFEFANGCYQSNVCSASEGCPGFESLTRASLWSDAAQGIRTEMDIGASFVCDGTTCRTTPRPLAHDALANTVWEPCGSDHFLWEADGSFEAGYDRGCVDGRAAAGASGRCSTDGRAVAAERPAIELRGRGPWRGVAQGAVRLSVATDGSVDSEGITQITATCFDGPPDLDALGRLTRPAGQGCSTTAQPGRWAMLIWMLALGGVAVRRRTV